MHLIGNVKNCVALIVDDMIDTAGTLCTTAQAVLDNGAKKVAACATHGVLSGSALAKIKESVLSNVFITDSISFSDKILSVDKIQVLSISSLLGEAIRRIDNKESVSSLFI
jgi:ribose-phosphate pyrophosphokinase